MLQAFHSWAFTHEERKYMSTQLDTNVFAILFVYPQARNNPNAHQQRHE